MTVYDALPSTLTHFRALLLGAPTSTPHSVESGHFRDIDRTEPLDEQPVSIFGNRPIEVLWTESVIADETGPEQFSGNLVDSSATLVVRVGYVHGQGRIASIGDLAAADSRLIRRVLEEPGNYAADTTGLCTVTWVRSVMGTKDRDGRVILDMQFRVRVREDQPQ